MAEGAHRSSSGAEAPARTDPPPPPGHRSVGPEAARTEVVEPLLEAAEVPGDDLDGPPEAGGAQRRLALRGGLWSAASQVIPALGTAVLSVAAGRYLGSSALGQQSLIAYVNSASSSVLIYALNAALLQVGGRLVGRGDERSLRALTRWSIGAHAAIGLVIFAGMASTALFVDQNASAWVTLGAVSVLDAVADGLAVRLILREGWAPMGRLRLIFQFIGPPLGLVFLFAGGGITGIFLGDGLAALGLLVAVLARFRKLERTGPIIGPGSPADGSAVPEFDRAPIWSLRRGVWAPVVPHHRPFAPPVPVGRAYTLFFLAELIAQVVSRRVEFVVLALFSTDRAIGMYSVAFMAVNLISMVPLGVAGAAMPLVAAAEGRGELDAANRHLRFALRVGTVVTIPLVGLLASVGPAAVDLVYGSSYTEAARLVPIASLALLVAVIAGVCTQFWAGQGRLRIVLGAGLAAAVADLGVALVLIPHLDALGAVIANLAGQLALAGGLLLATVRNVGALGWRLRRLVATVGATGCGIVAALAVRIGLDRALPGVELRSLVVLIVGTTVFSVVTLVALRVVGLFDTEEAGWLRPLVPGRLRGVLDQLTAQR